MNNNTKNKNCITSVGCDVTNCAYNTADRHCSAQRIDVKNEAARAEFETFCSTFSPKGTMQG